MFLGEKMVEGDGLSVRVKTETVPFVREERGSLAEKEKKSASVASCSQWEHVVPKKGAGAEYCLPDECGLKEEA